MSCRRCQECVHYTHHWIDNPDFGNPIVSERLQKVEFVCKHCDAFGGECDMCQGEGCSWCDGEGVEEYHPELLP